MISSANPTIYTEQDTIRNEDLAQQHVGDFVTGRLGTGNLEQPPITGPNKNKIRPINIEEVNSGYIVKVGCHTFALSKKKLLKSLVAYINDPETTETKWFLGELI